MYAAVLLLIVNEAFNATWRYWLVGVLILMLIVLVMVFLQLRAISTQLTELWHEMRGEGKRPRRE
jgi:hypothetical protein